MTGPLGEVVILLGAAMVFVILFRRIGLGAVLGYLVAGAAVGQQGLGWVGGGEAKLEFAEIGIALLLFLVGMELNPARLWKLKREIFGLGLAQVLLCALALFGFLIAMLGFTWQAILALAMPLALSSTAQVLPSLKSSGRINSPFGERAFSILLFQDLSIVPLITIIAALSRSPADAAAPPGWQMALYTVGAVAGLVLAGRFLLHPLLRIVGRIGERELFVFVGLFAVLASAGLMAALHLSTALGAFVAGVMLADSPYRHELEADVEPFRSILLGLFFLAVSLFGAVVTLSMATTPFLMLFARFLEYTPGADAADELDGPDRAPRGKALVVGYGRFGQVVAQMLHAVDCSVTLIDKKPAQIETSGRFDVKVYYGDGLRLDVLHQAGADDAAVIAFCIDDRALTAEQLAPIMHAFPQARIFVRAFDRRQLMALHPANVHGAVRELYESAISMGLMTLQAIDIDPDEIADAERAVRQLDAARLDVQIESGDMRAGSDMRFTASSNKRPLEILDALANRLRGDAR